MARHLADFARKHGYPQARVLPHPGLPAFCRGEPCLGVGPGPGEFLSILLRPDPLPGPDPTSAQTSQEEWTAFIDGTVLPRNQKVTQETASSGLTMDGLRQSDFDISTLYPQDLQPGVLWIPFTLFEGQAWNVSGPSGPVISQQ